MTELQRIRKAAGLTQIEVAVRARVSPPTARNFERFGPRAVSDEDKCARLQATYESLKAETAGKQTAA